MKYILQLSAIIYLFCSVQFNANATAFKQQPEQSNVETDSTAFAKVVVYRPDGQLKHTYQLKTPQNDRFSLKKKTATTLDSFSSVFDISADAKGHQGKRYSFTLSKGKTHYFRVQDRYNYAALRPFLEVIEVTEETYKRDLKL